METENTALENSEERHRVIEIVIAPEARHHKKRDLIFEVSCVEKQTKIVFCFEQTQEKLANIFDTLYFANEKIVPMNTIQEELKMNRGDLYERIDKLESLIDIVNSKLAEFDIPKRLVINNVYAAGYILKFVQSRPRRFSAYPQTANLYPLGSSKRNSL